MPVDSPAYPVNLILEGRPVLVVGGGAVAASKVRGLLAVGAVVHVVSRSVSDEVRALAATWEERPYAAGEASGYRLAVTCTDDPAVNQAVFDDAEAAGVWVNAADDPERCSYTLPARLDRGHLLITVSTSGHSPALASWLRDQLALVVGPEHDVLLGLLTDARAALAAEGTARPPANWREALDSGMLDLIRSGRVAEAREVLHTSLRLGAPPSSETQ
ncbi:MAG: bifunctional precorrin-2 dehydrogenase/sirohydrochlorin ferrochelatase [Acidimicrobiales bacterium]